VSASVFYKQLTAPIEQAFIRGDGSKLGYRNSGPADLFGVEFEARKSLAMLHPQLADFSVGGNVALIQSSTDLDPLEYQFKTNILPHAESTRPLFEQSPYILNLDASYDNRASGTSVSLIYNVSGPRLILASLTSEDVYEQPAPTLDLIFSQRIGRQATIKLTAKNLLDSIRERTYGKDGQLIFSSYRVGRTFGVSLSYDF
jgi:outer membrane receptor protein involved in Fe transport